MNTLTRQGRITGSLQGLGASWWSVGLFAVVLSFANGFIVASMQWTVGAIERLSPPFEQWMFNSVVMIPVYAIAIIGALYLARRLAGSGSGKVKKQRIGMGASLDPRRSGVNGALARDSAPAVRVVVTPGLRRPHSGLCQGGPRFASITTRSPFQRMPDRDGRVPVRVSQAPGPSPADPGMCQGGARFKVSRRRPVVHPAQGENSPSP